MLCQIQSETKSMQQQGTTLISKSSCGGGGGGAGLSVPRPSIRVVHIFAPKIIKTDAANFRSLVQRLTGRSSSSRGHMEQKKKEKKNSKSSSSSSSRGNMEQKKKEKKKKSKGLLQSITISCAHYEETTFQLPGRICSSQQKQLFDVDPPQVKSELYADLDADCTINPFANLPGNILDRFGGGGGGGELNSAWPAELHALFSPATNPACDLSATFSPPYEPIS